MKCFVGIDLSVWKEKVCMVNGFNMKIIEKELADQMASNFMVEILVRSHVSRLKMKED